MSFKHVSDEILSGYLAGELTAREKYDADSHFTICPECAAKLEKQRAFEKKIADAYNSSFSLYLSPDARNAVSGEISAGLAVDTKAPLWKKRIIVKFLAQVASVTLVAAAVAVMVLTQSRNAQPVIPESDAAPAVAAVTPVEKPSVAPAPVKKPAAPAVPAVPVKKPAAPVKQVKTIAKTQPVVMTNKIAAVKSAKKVDAAAKTKSVPVIKNDAVKQPAPPIVKTVAVKPAPVTPPVQQPQKQTQPAPKTVIADPMLQQHDSLVKLFRIGQIRIRKNADHIFLIQGVKSPFADDLYVIYAAAGVPEKDSARRVELTLVPNGRIAHVNMHPAMQKDVCVMSFRTRVLSGEIGKLDSVITDGQDKQSNSLTVGKDVIIPDFNAAPEQVRLAAVMQAASVPRLILKRDIRAKVLIELEKLLKGGYASDPQVKSLYQQLKKVR